MNRLQSPKSPLAFLFDLDGTLVDGFAAIHASVNHVRSLNRLPPMSPDEVRSAVGNGLKKLIELTCPVGDPENNAREYLRDHPDRIKSGTFFYPDVLDTLAELRRRSVKLAVCSNKPLELTRRLLDDFSIADWFDAVLGPESALRRKPAPDMLLEACRLIDVRPSDALYVGDMPVDVEAGRGARVETWLIVADERLRDSIVATKPDHIMRSFRELLDR